MIGASIWLAALAVTPGGRIALEGESSCPTLAEIAQRLQEVAPEAATTGAALPATVVHVSRIDGAVRLELAGAESQVLATRDLPATEACDDLAAAAAVVIATWQSDLNPQTSPGVELPATTPETLAPPPVVMARPALTPTRPRFLGIGLLASTAGGQVTPGAAVRASVDVGPAWLGLGGTLGATTSRTADVTNHPDAARWTRGWLGLGPELHTGRENRLEGHVHGLLGLLHVEGVGLTAPRADTKFDLGAGGGVSVAHWVGNASIWLGVDVLVWPGRQRLLIEGAPLEQGGLPHIDLQLAAGIGLGGGR